MPGRLSGIYRQCLWIIEEKEGENAKIKKNQKESQYIYQNKLVKACFENDVPDGDFKNLLRRTAYDKALSDRDHLKFSKKPKVNINVDLPQRLTTFLGKKSRDTVTSATHTEK